MRARDLWIVLLLGLYGGAVGAVTGWHAFADWQWWALTQPINLFVVGRYFGKDDAEADR